LGWRGFSEENVIDKPLHAGLGPIEPKDMKVIGKIARR
jgi:hypothetical protein